MSVHGATCGVVLAASLRSSGRKAVCRHEWGTTTENPSIAKRTWSVQCLIGSSHVHFRTLARSLAPSPKAPKEECCPLMSVLGVSAGAAQAAITSPVKLGRRAPLVIGGHALSRAPLRVLATRAWGRSADLLTQALRRAVWRRPTYCSKLGRNGRRLPRRAQRRAWERPCPDCWLLSGLGHGHHDRAGPEGSADGVGSGPRPIRCAVPGGLRDACVLASRRRLLSWRGCVLPVQPHAAPLRATHS